MRFIIKTINTPHCTIRLHYDSKPNDKDFTYEIDLCKKYGDTIEYQSHGYFKTKLFALLNMYKYKIILNSK